MSLGGRSAERPCPKFPSPGQYAAGMEKGYDQTLNANPSYKFGTAPRASMAFKTDGAPPGTYDPDKCLDAASRSAPCFSMMSRRKPARADTTPGPIYPHYTQFDR